MPGIREDARRIQERNREIMPPRDELEGKPLYLELMYLRFPTLPISIGMRIFGMYIDPYAEASFVALGKGFIRNIRKYI